MPKNGRPSCELKKNERRLRVAIRLALTLCVTCLAVGCATDLTGTTSEAQCAGREPINYTSTKKNSPYYAGPKLAPQLAVANLTGINLKCPAFADAPPPR